VLPLLAGCGSRHTCHTCGLLLQPLQARRAGWRTGVTQATASTTTAGWRSGRTARGRSQVGWGWGLPGWCWLAGARCSNPCSLTAVDFIGGCPAADTTRLQARASSTPPASTKRGSSLSQHSGSCQATRGTPSTRRLTRPPARPSRSRGLRRIGRCTASTSRKPTGTLPLAPCRLCSSSCPPSSWPGC
jgi:hypothetical protein